MKPAAGFASIVAISFAFLASPATASTLDDCRSGERGSASMMTACTTLTASSDVNSKFSGYAKRGEAYLNDKDLAKAKADLLAARKLRPESQDNTTNLFFCHLHLKEYSAAMALVDEAQKTWPKDKMDYVRTGRQIVLQMQGDNDGLIDMMNVFLAEQPDNEFAMATRGEAYFANGNFEAALADYNKAIGLRPMGSFHIKRGILRFYTGAIASAAEDFKKAVEISDSDVEAAIWRELAGKRAGYPTHLEEALPKLQVEGWPGPVVKLLMGNSTPGAVLASPETGSPLEIERRKCEADLYGAEFMMTQKNSDEAARHYKAALKDCTKGFYQWRAATIGLSKL